jgi:hypothetical protein
MALYLNGAHKVIAYSVVSTGTATSAPVHPREVYQPAILVGATAVLLGHNHPSGSTEPSVEDHKITKSLKAAAEVLGLKLLDHLVISDRDYFSFHSNGALWGPRRYRSIGSAFATGRRIGESGSQSLPRSSRGGMLYFFLSIVSEV